MTTPIDSWKRAALHPIERQSPAVNFFEGAVLGNGGLGAIVCTRPDAVVIHFGHNNVWDIRISEARKSEYGTFQEVFEKVKAVPSTAASLLDDEWCKNYFELTRESYAKPYPRPFPCGSFILGFDRRKAELLGHRLDISNGRCEVRFLVEGRIAILEVFVEMSVDRLWIRFVDESGTPIPHPFQTVKLAPHSRNDPKADLTIDPPTVPDNLPADTLSFRQVMPFQEPHLVAEQPTHPKDKAFRLSLRVNHSLEARERTATWSGIPEKMGPLEGGLPSGGELVAYLQLDEGLATQVENDAPALASATFSAHQKARTDSQTIWEEYWTKSGVALDDELLERTWYWNLYFLNCSAKAGVNCPGLFANWSYRDIGTAWHGDYHMNYNTQQPFWATFSSNHVEKNLPYVELVERVLPLERQWAREYYGLRGAYGMHSLYPVEMTTNPYAVPHWGWEICETPWTMQGLWWHYLYTQDREFLEHRAFVPIKDAVLFLVDYLKRPEARGPQWGDDHYHIFPTVPPELYSLQPGFKFNHDAIVDLTLTKFIFNAFQAACKALGREESEAPLLDEVREVQAHFPPYPTAETSFGKVFIVAPGAHPEIVQNTPDSTMTVFPGEDHGLHSPPEEFEIAANSYRQHRNEGGNELVFLNLQGARLGLLDLEKFKRQIRYSLTPNGTCADMCLQTLGRYTDDTPFDFMARMGIWFENFGLPVVINECLLQSYTGTLRFFPNWPREKRAEFHTLRAVGAFLVSAVFENGETQWIEILSEAGAPLELILPWPEAILRSSVVGEKRLSGSVAKLDTTRGETLRLEKV